MSPRLTAGWIVVLLLVAGTRAAEPADSKDSLVFRVSFDKSMDADVARGDGRVHMTGDLTPNRTLVPGFDVPGIELAPGEGRRGGALRFREKTDRFVCYPGAGNVPYREQGFEMTVSLWMSLDPAHDLPVGYVDPLQITDKEWNNSCLFLDFDREPRDFRLGVFSDFSFWNPRNRPWEEIPVAERPMIVAHEPPFARGKWTHVAITVKNFNTDGQGVAALYLNGEPIGERRGPQQFTWDPEKAVIILGIYYVGLMDDFEIYNRAFTAEEIQGLAK
jgi:hypothetical protein